MYIYIYMYIYMCIYIYIYISPSPQELSRQESDGARVSLILDVRQVRALTQS